MKKQLAFGLAGLTAAASIMAGVSANSFGMMKGQGMFGPGENTQVSAALESGNLSAYRQALIEENAKLVNSITEEEFQQMAGRHVASKEMETALEAKDYNGFVTALQKENTNATISQAQFNAMVERDNTHDAMEAAVDNADYNAYVSATESLPFGRGMREVITQEQFNKLVEIDKAKDSGDFSTLRQLGKEFGFQKGPRGNTHMRMVR